MQQNLVRILLKKHQLNSLMCHLILGLHMLDIQGKYCTIQYVSPMPITYIITSSEFICLYCATSIVDIRKRKLNDMAQHQSKLPSLSISGSQSCSSQFIVNRNSSTGLNASANNSAVYNSRSKTCNTSHQPVTGSHHNEYRKAHTTKLTQNDQKAKLRENLKDYRAKVASSEEMQNGMHRKRHIG